MPPKQQQIPIKRGEDSTYRYKMPAIQSNSIVRGKTVKTTIVNFPDVCLAINRTQKLLLRWFQYSIGVTVKQEKESGPLTLWGEHDEKKLLESLYDFIDTFVMCSACKNPETTFEMNGTDLNLHCSSCGNTTKVISTKTPVIRTIEYIKANLTEEQKTKNITKQQRGAIDDIDDLVRNTNTLSEKENGYLNVQELTKIYTTINATEAETQKSQVTEEQIEAFREKLAKRLHSDEPDMPIYQDMNKMFKLIGLTPAMQFKLLIEDMFLGHKKEMIDLINKRKNIFILLTTESGTDKELLSVLSGFIEEPDDEGVDLMKSAPAIFYTLYNNEIVQEDTFKAWKDRPSRRFEKNKTKNAELRANLAEFFNWLDTAEYEEE